MSEWYNKLSNEAWKNGSETIAKTLCRELYFEEHEYYPSEEYIETNYEKYLLVASEVYLDVSPIIENFMIDIRS